MDDASPVSRIHNNADMIDFTSHALAELDDALVFDSETTQDARPLSSAYIDEYVPPADEDVEVPEPPSSRHATNSKLRLYSRPYTVKAPPITLQQGLLLLRDYLKRQKVVNLKRVIGVYVLEDVIKNPERYPHAKERAKELSTLKKIPRTFTSFREAAAATPSGDNKKIRFIKTPTVVLVPLHYVRLLRGTRAERNDFESMLYHEVEGHGVDFEPDSEHMIHIFKIYAKFEERNNAYLYLLMAAHEDVTEVCAYLTELDRLVSKFNFPRNQSIITTRRKDIIENHLVFHLANILDPKASDQDELVRAVNEYSYQFVRHRFLKASPETRKYVRKVLRERGWRRPIPF